jgi:hypothetical protein
VPFPRTVRRLLSAAAGVAAAAALAPGGLLAAASAAASGTPPALPAAPAPDPAPAPAPANAAASLRACPAATQPGTMACQALISTTAPDGLAGRRPAAPRRDGYGPASLRAAYRLPGGTAGRGQTVAVIGAFRNPHIRSDLAIYREAWGLPACRRSCFRILDEDGDSGPLPALAGSTGWAVQAAVDLDVVSAVCPRCHLLLVEARSASVADLGAAVNAAVAAGAKYVTNGYGGLPSSSGAGRDTAYYRHPGVAVTAAAGDLGGRLAWLAGYGTKITQRISQKVAIPAGCTSATLTFWLQVASTARKAPAADTLTLTAVSPAGQALGTLATFSNRDAGKGYQQHTVSLTAYLGQTISLRFTSRERLVGKVTSFFEDGNVLKVS